VVALDGSALGDWLDCARLALNCKPSYEDFEAKLVLRRAKPTEATRNFAASCGTTDTHLETTQQDPKQESSCWWHIEIWEI
jgi:hypothetical protein